MTFKKRFLSVLLTLLVIFQIGYCCMPTASAASNKDIIFEFLKSELGYNTATACGILANIEHESNFNPNITGDQGTSYGICQWHATRFTSLKNYCNQNGYDWKTLTGQLYFLKYEITTQNKSLNTKLKGYANTAQGAYNAGYTWCYDFERPANKATRAVERGNLAKSKYWPLYACEVQVPTITLTSPSSATTTITEGGTVNIWGTISAKGAKTTVKGYIKDSSGKVLQTATDSVSSTLDIKNSTINNKLLFGKLEPGTYTLYITAQNSKGTASATKKIVVKADPTKIPKVKSVKIDDIKVSYSKHNNTTTIKPTISAESGAKYTVTWSSSDKSVATIDSNGKITALKSGNATITCKVTDTAGNTVKDTCTVNVALSWWEWIIVLLFQGLSMYI